MKKVFADKPLLRFGFLILRGLVMVYIGFSLYLALFQRRAMYYPTKAPFEDLAHVASKLGMAPWFNQAEELIGWRPAADVPPQADILLVFHGNAGFALHRTYFVDGFQHRQAHQAFHVFLMEYPGYGSRAGSPSQASMTTAAEEALLQLRRDYPGRRIFVLGESIGSGVAAQLAASHPAEVAGLFLLTAFTSLTDVAVHHYPILPVRLLLQDRYESARALESYHGPVAILLAGNDTVIPQELGQALYEAYQGPKRLWLQEHAGHNTLNYDLQAIWWEEVSSFLQQNAAPAPVKL
jgi:pimeloyl-ACP methyl ester carboxylesterase